MNEPRHLPEWAIGLIASLIVSAAGVAVVWGEYEQRVAALERSQSDNWSTQREVNGRLAAHDTQLALIDQKLTTLVDQVRLINEKLDRADDERHGRVSP